MKPGGFCWLNNYCQNYNYLWKYSFQVRFANSTWSNYLNIPLSTFAQNQYYDGQRYCVLYIEALDTSKADSRSIILGSMFYQSFYVQYNYYGFNGQQVNIFVNPNAPQQNMPLLQNATYPTQAFSPFEVQPQPLPVSYDSNGLPQFEVLMGGITDNTSPNF